MVLQSDVHNISDLAIYENEVEWVRKIFGLTVNDSYGLSSERKRICYSCAVYIRYSEKIGRIMHLS